MALINQQPKEPSLLEVYDALFPGKIVTLAPEPKSVGSQPTNQLCRTFGQILEPITFRPLDVAAIFDEVGL
jgi:hypothetical protein